MSSELLLAPTIHLEIVYIVCNQSSPPFTSRRIAQRSSGQTTPWPRTHPFAAHTGSILSLSKKQDRIQHFDPGSAALFSPVPVPNFSPPLRQCFPWVVATASNPCGPCPTSTCPRSQNMSRSSRPPAITTSPAGRPPSILTVTSPLETARRQGLRPQYHSRRSSTASSIFTSGGAQDGAWLPDAIAESAENGSCGGVWQCSG